MRLFGRDRDCGPLLDLNELHRQLRLGAPVIEGEATIPVGQIIGSVNRAQDFDGCFRPLRPALEKRLRDIERASPSSLDEPIDVVRIDRAYFVADGHKRVALARQTGREFIDAHVSRLSSEYALTPEVEDEAIERTAREGEFRRHTGLAQAVPDARFALTVIAAYGELFDMVQSFAYDMAEREGRFVPRREAAASWYESVYRPTVAIGRERVGRLIDSCTDADVFMAMQRHSRTLWGTDCDVSDCAADMLLAEARRTASERSGIGRVLSRTREPGRRPTLLPLADTPPAPEDAN